jgi:DNA modification methylase
MEVNKILQGNCLEVLKTLPDKVVNTVITSPPYWGLRDYGVDGQIGLEPSPEEFIQQMVEVFREVRRVLKNDGTLWLNLGDSYWANRSTNGLEWSGNYGKSKDYMLRAGNKKHDFLKPKDLIGIPWRVAFALQQDGWYLRSDIIWNKPSCMPEAVKDRPTKSHEYIFLLSKQEHYYYDYESIKEPAVGFNNEPIAGSKGAFGPAQSRRRKGNSKTFRGGGVYTNNQSFHNDKLLERESHGNKPNETGLRNKRSVWTVAIKPFKAAHFATYPPNLIEPCVLAGCPKDGVVLDPFFGSGTTGEVAIKHNRNFIGIELNPEYIKIAEKRLCEVQTELINEL